MKKYGIYIRNLITMPWLQAEIEKVANAESNRPLADLFREAFCEYWGQKYPSLKEKHEAQKKLLGVSE